jgi:glycosyltransferase involved in cell wall biosynthesis
VKVLFVTGSFPPMKCGVGEYTAALAEAIAKHPGMYVAVLTDVAAAGGKRVPGVDLLPVADGWRLRDALPIVKTIRRFSPDIVHVQYPTQGYSSAFLPVLLPILGRMAGALVVQTRHEHMTRSGVLVHANALFTRKIVVVRPDFTEVMSPRYRWLKETREFRFIPNASAIPAVRLSEAERKAVASRYSPGERPLVVHFGFAAVHKGVDRIFEIADPGRDHIVLACDLEDSDPYQRTVRKVADSPPWRGKVTVTGFLPAEELAQLLAAADAVVFPFRTGGGIWNSSIHAAIGQGSFVLTTSTETHGYLREQNTYYALPENTEEMREALSKHIGCRNEPARNASDWSENAQAHIELYLAILKPPGAMIGS